MVTIVIHSLLWRLIIRQVLSLLRVGAAIGPPGGLLHYVRTCSQVALNRFASSPTTIITNSIWSLSLH